jgi:hypothetical protein
VENILNEDLEHRKDARNYGRQIIESSSFPDSKKQGNEELPNEFYRDIVDNIRRRISSCEEDIALFSQQLESPSMSISGPVENAYGHQIKVGPKELTKLLQLQNETFIRIASTVAMVDISILFFKAIYLIINIIYLFRCIMKLKL